MPFPTDTALPRRQRGAGLLALWVAFWLLTQALGQAHGVLHAGLAAPPAGVALATTAPAVAPRPFERAFHPQPDGGASHDNGGLCRLYGQLAQGDLAFGAPQPAAAPYLGDAPAPATAFASAAAPRVALRARGPPALG